jgi:integrase
MVLHLMALYGLRTGEITRLKIDSINWSARSLLVEQVKTHSWLTLPLMDQTLDLLQLETYHRSLSPKVRCGRGNDQRVAGTHHA